MTDQSPKEAAMPEVPKLDEAIERLETYLNEVDRVNAAQGGKLMNWQHADAVHGLNEFEIRRSDVRVVLAALKNEREANSRRYEAERWYE
jgi:hypothetical protein